MRIFLILLTKELKTYFYSPIAWVVVALMMLVNAFSFKAALSILQSAPSTGSLVKWCFDAPWFWLAFFFIFPLLTMRLFAEEEKMGTLETLLTAPVTSGQVVLAKYGASLIFYLFLWIPSSLNFLIFQWISHGMADVPAGQILGSYLLLFLMGVANLSIGCFASALTKNQIIAAVLCFTLCLLHYLFGFFVVTLGRDLPTLALDLASIFASSEHIKIFVDGLLDSRAMVYYLSLASLFLFLTLQVVEFRRWKA